MRRNILIRRQGLIKLFVLFFLLSGFVELSAQNVVIRSLRCYSSNDQILFPVIDSKDPDKSSITIEFDVVNNLLPSVNLLFRFCDKNWQPYENSFLLNPGYDTEYNLYFERLPSTVQNANFHYKGTFPDNNVRFPFSGKWMFFIVDSQDKNIVYGSGKFYVVYPQVKLRSSISKERMEGKTPQPAELGRTIGIRTNFILPDSLVPGQVRFVEIIENMKINQPIQIDRSNYGIDKFYEWNGSNNFSFVARQLQPGNEYRQTDFRNVGEYPPGTINARKPGIETSDFFKMNPPDYNGASILTNFRDKYADYLNVNFKLRAPENIKSPIFLVGAFTDWKVLPEYEMFDDNGLMNLSVLLKRGLYDYQYITAEYSGDEITNVDWHILEGNFWETKNIYHIFLFYETTDLGGYDKIIGHIEYNSGVLWVN